mgnify:CR=1 FL=1
MKFLWQLTLSWQLTADFIVYYKHLLEFQLGFHKQALFWLKWCRDKIIADDNLLSLLALFKWNYYQKEE